MVKVPDLINLFEKISGGAGQPLQTSFSRPVYCGISADKKTASTTQKLGEQLHKENISILTGDTVKAQWGIQNRTKSLFSTIYDKIPSFFKSNSQPLNTLSTKSTFYSTRQTDVQETDDQTFSKATILGTRDSYVDESTERCLPKPAPTDPIYCDKNYRDVNKDNDYSSASGISAKHKTNLPVDSSEQAETEQFMPKTASPVPVLGVEKLDKDINSYSCHTDPKQLLGSNKNIAFLVGTVNNHAEEHLRRQSSQENRESKEEKCIHSRNSSIERKECTLPRFSLFEGDRWTENIQQKFASTSFDESDHDQSKHDQSHRVKEQNITYSKPMSKASSLTSGIYSGSNAVYRESEIRDVDQKDKDNSRSTTLLKMQAIDNNETYDKHYVQSTYGTEHYVEQQAHSAERSLNSRKKYFSEPSISEDLPLRARTLTQGNIDTQGSFIRIRDSNVSINSGLSESMTESQFSVFSSEQETRESIADHTREFLEAHEKYPRVQELRRLKKALKVLQEEGVVIIAGDNGSGGTHLGWDLLLADGSKEKFNVLDISSLEICYRSKGSRVILADDIFGETKVDEYVVEKCLKYIKLIKKSKSLCDRSVKFIFTVKHNIFKHLRQKLNDFKKCIVDLEDEKLQLDCDEKIQIMKALIENHQNENKVILDRESEQVLPITTRKGWTYISEDFLSQVAENTLSSGFPKTFLKFLETKENTQLGLEFFTHPTDELLKEVIYMKNSSDQADQENNLTLTLTTVFGGKLTLEKIRILQKSQLQNNKKEKSHKKKKSERKSHVEADIIEKDMDRPWWFAIGSILSGICKRSLLESVKSGLTYLKGRYIKEDIKGVYSFAAPCVKNAVLISLGQDFPQHILKLCDLQFFKDYVGSDSCFKKDEGRCVRIDVQNIVVCSMANQLLIELADNNDIESFSRHRLFYDEQFLQQFFDTFKDDADLLWNMGRKTDLKTGRFAISCFLDTKYSPLHFPNTVNFAYSLLFHKVWRQKRKFDKEWSAKMEKDVIRHCCKRHHEDVYFNLRKKYNIPVDYNCLRAAIACGSCAIVEDILRSIGKYISDKEMCLCMELALMKYTRKPLRSRHDVVHLLLKYVSVDYKISGLDPFIHAATKSGDARAIVTLKVFDGDINVTNFEGKTCLYEAIKRNNAAFLQMALRHGADQWKNDKFGTLPIHEVAKENKSYLVKLLVDNDFKVAEATDGSGRQPLHYASIYDSFEAATVLLECGIEVDRYDHDNKTPLHYAAASGRASVMHSLLEAHANKSKTDKNGDPPLLIACKTGNIKGVKRLIQDINQTELDAWSNECIFASVERSDLNILEMLIKRGFDVNKKNKNGKFPLHVAASYGKRDAFQMLVDAGANIEQVTLDTGDTVLHIAIANGHDTLTNDILLKDESLIGCRNKQVETPLHIAARKGNLPVVRDLLSYGAEKSPINKNWQTPQSHVEEMLDNLKGQTHTDAYNNLFEIKLLLMGHKSKLETAL